MGKIKICWLWVIAVFFCFSSLGLAQEKSQSPVDKLVASLEAAKTEEESSALLVANKELVTQELEKRLAKEGLDLLNQGRFPEALIILKVAQNLALQFGDRAGLAGVLDTTGHVYRQQGDYKQSLEYFQNSLKISEELQDRSGIAMTLNGMGLIHFAKGEYDKALSCFERSLALGKELGDKRRMAIALERMSLVYITRGNYGQALDCLQNSLAISEETKDKQIIADISNSMGYLYANQGNYEKGLEAFQRCLNLSLELNLRPRVATVYNNMGEVYRLQGNYKKAFEYFQKSLKLRQELNDRAGIATTLNNIGYVHSLQGNYAQALEFCQKSLELREELKNKLGVVRALNNIGNIYRAQGDLKKTLEYFQRSLKIADESKLKLESTHALNGIGDALFSQGSPEKAIEHYRRSLALSEELANRAGASRALSRIGEAFRALGENEKALEFAGQAANIAEQIGEPEVLWQAQYTLGLANRALNKIDQSRHSLEDAVRTIETIRAQVGGDQQAQQSFFENKVAAYQDIVELLISQKEDAEALASAERAKARVILDVLQSGRVNITSAMTAQEREEEKRLNSELVSLNTQIYREKQRKQPDAILLATLNEDLKKVQLEFDSFRSNLYAAHPELKTKRVDIQPVTLTEALSLLPDSQSALLEFVVKEEKTYLFVLTEKQRSHNVRRVTARPKPDLSSVDLTVYSLDIKRKDLEKLVTQYRNMLATKDLAFRKPGQEIYNLLLKPAQEQLKGKTTLVIVPEGILWELPFQALQTPENRYLLEDHTIFYTPSLTALREMIRPHNGIKDRSNLLLAFGNPALANSDMLNMGPGQMGPLGPLPGAELQVKKIAGMYGPGRGKCYVGTEAREERVKAEAGNYRILHFATHGIVNNSSPMYSHLLLSQTEDGSSEDGLLEAREIVEMDLHADLAVLAACETARGRVRAGEGVIGLAWAFFVAGCPATVVSQWKVEDTATKDLMLEFHSIVSQGYKNPQNHISKAAALREAALKILHTSSEPLPFYWAGFVLIGNGR